MQRILFYCAYLMNGVRRCLPGGRDREGMIVYRFDIIMQGAGETAFFNL